MFDKLGTWGVLVVVFEERCRRKLIGVVVAIEGGESEAGLRLDDWNDDFDNLKIEIIVSVEECFSEIVEKPLRGRGAVGAREDFISVGWCIPVAGGFRFFTSASARFRRVRGGNGRRHGRG